MLKLSGGQSDKNQITFRTINNSATAIWNENDEIKIKFDSKDSVTLKEILVSFVIFSLPFLIKRFVLIPLIVAGKISTMFYLSPALLCFFLIILAIVVVRKHQNQSILKNHGAKHMVYSAYNHLQRVPTVEEAKQFSRINKICGITIYSTYIACQVIGFIVFLCTGYMISEIILVLAPLFVRIRTLFPFNFIGKIPQLFTTSTPERCNLELAIAAISALEKLELSGDMSLSTLEKSI